VALLPDDPVVSIEPRLQTVANTLGQFIAQNQERGVRLEEFPFSQPFCLDEAGWVANRWADLLMLERTEKVSLLAELDPQLRLSRVNDLLSLSRGNEDFD